jgi:hypothetical protein
MILNLRECAARGPSNDAINGDELLFQIRDVVDKGLVSCALRELAQQRAIALELALQFQLLSIRVHNR